MLQHPENVLIKIESVLEKARDARRPLEADTFGLKSTSGYEFPEGALKEFLREAETLLEVILEAADLPLTRLRLMEKWTVFEKEGLGKTTTYPEGEYLESAPLDYLERVVEALRLTLGRAQDSWESYELQKLDSLLRKTATILKREGVKRPVPSHSQSVFTDT